MKTELLIGCGNSRQKRMHPEGASAEWSNLITLDFSEDCRPDVVHDLEDLPYPFEDNSFDEIHAYEVLEHTGNQGDWKFFFDQFSELHRILKPDGCLYASVPNWQSIWAWGDPSHKRVLSPASLVFLNQAQYQQQVGKTAMTDYRSYWAKNFDIDYQKYEENSFLFVLKAKKDDLSGHGNNILDKREPI